MPSRWATSQIWKVRCFLPSEEPHPVYADEDASYYQNHFSDISIGNASGTDGRIYGIPKDKDNVLLVYNKEMFDAAGVAYPTADWTWDDLTDASQKVFDATGKYGYMAYNDEQLGYWNFVYQKGGYILDPETNIHAGYTQPATAEAVKLHGDVPLAHHVGVVLHLVEEVPAALQEHTAHAGEEGPSLSATLTTCWIWNSATDSSTTPSSTSTTPAAGSGSPT